MKELHVSLPSFPPRTSANSVDSSLHLVLVSSPKVTCFPSPAMNPAVGSTSSLSGLNHPTHQLDTSLLGMRRLAGNLNNLPAADPRALHNLQATLDNLKDGDWSIMDSYLPAPGTTWTRKLCQQLDDMRKVQPVSPTSALVSLHEQSAEKS